MEISIVVETPTLLEGEREEMLPPESVYCESCVIQFLNRTAKFTFKDSCQPTFSVKTLIVAFTF